MEQVPYEKMPLMVTGIVAQIRANCQALEREDFRDGLANFLLQMRPYETDGMHEYPNLLIAAVHYVCAFRDEKSKYHASPQWSYAENEASYKQGWSIFNYELSQPPLYRIERLDFMPDSSGEPVLPPVFGSDEEAIAFVNQEAAFHALPLRAILFLAHEARHGNYYADNKPAWQQFHEDFPKYAFLVDPR